MPEQALVGFLKGNVPYLKVGHGPPLVSVLGLTSEHEPPTGADRRFALTHTRPLAKHFTVYVVNRPRALEPGASMSDIAGHLADAIDRDIGQPVFLEGTSTGGSVALQLAVDRPDLVRRLVLVSAAYRLGPRGRELQAEMARLIRAGQPREAWASTITATLPGWLRSASLPVARLAVAPMVPADPSDLLVTIAAEDSFDVRADLPRVTSPTLVLGGSKDHFYSEDLFRETSAGVRDGRVHIFPGWGHARASMSTATSHLTLGFVLADEHARDVR
jgi:pimeloyl-ACP methyl ester carboxylesterase